VQLTRTERYKDRILSVVIDQRRVDSSVFTWFVLSRAMQRTGSDLPVAVDVKQTENLFATEEEAFAAGFEMLREFVDRENTQAELLRKSLDGP